MLFLSESDVRRLLPMKAAIRLMREAFAGLRDGRSLNQPRRRLILSTGSVLHYMVAAHGEYFGAKIYSTNPRHGAHFLSLLYSAPDARMLALLEANYLGRIRTGAASGYATDLLAPPNAGTMALIGSGFQAYTQLEAVLAVRPIRQVRVWSRSAGKREAFAAECSEAFSVPVEPCTTAEQAVRNAAIVTTVTNSKEPVLRAEWVADGAHVNAAGSNQAQRRELPPELLGRAALIAVDSLEQARMESGDLLLAMPPDQWPSRGVVELKDVTGRPHPGALTIFKSNGLALEDVVSAAYVYETALRERTGREITLEQASAAQPPAKR